MAKKNDLRNVHGQKSWRLKSDLVEAYVTRKGGHLGPVTFDRIERQLQPYSIAPWAEEKVAKGTPDIIKALRGDFFCLPFGGNDAAYKGEDHPVHGETANSRWSFEDYTSKGNRAELHLSLKTKIRKGRVDKYISLIFGHNAVYSRHVISGMSGNMPLGHHAMLRFPDAEGSGLISTSAMQFRQAYIQPTEDPAEGGYSILKPGAEFDSLSSVMKIDRKKADLSAYPARRGFEDIVIQVNDPTGPFAWTAVSFPEERYVWFALKDPNVLTSTLFWISNGGRHYAPWNGRHVNVMGLEEITGHFHEGLAASVGDNSLSARGFTTAISLSAKKPTTVNYIQACAPTPEGFDRVATIEPADDGVLLTSESGQTLHAPLDLGFLRGA